MDSHDVKKILAGFSIAALLSSAIALPGCSSSWTGSKKEGAGSTQKEQSEQKPGQNPGTSGWSGSKK